jgi:hypothetical protein
MADSLDFNLGSPRLVLGRRAFLASVLAAPALLPGCAGPTPEEISRRKYGYDPANFVDGITVWKGARVLALSKDGAYTQAYKINLGFEPVGPKVERNDGRTPEGLYLINRKNPNSDYHLSLGVSYPDEEDRAQAEARNVSPGGDIFVHGGPTRRADKNRADWTAGCVAVTDEQIEQIWAYCPVGTPIAIYA